MTRRKPIELARISGRAAHDPQRFRGRRSGWRLGPLGEPPEGLSEAEREAWEEFRRELPWLNQAHRQIVRVACLLQARVAADPAAGVNQLQLLSSVLSKLGASPADAGRLGQVDDDDGDDGAGKFFS